MKNLVINPVTKKPLDFQPNVFLLLWKLIFQNYWKNKINLFNDILLPLIIVSILLVTLKDTKLVDFYPGIITVSILSIGLISFPSTFVEWKTSVLVKRIQLVGVGLKSVLIVFGTFYIILSYLMFGIIIGYCILLDEFVVKVTDSKESFVNLLQNIRVGWFIIGVLQLNFIVIIFGYFLTYLTNKPKNIIGIGLLLYLIQAFVLGCYIPIRFSLPSDAVTFLSYGLPAYAPLRIIQSSFLIDQPVFDDPTNPVLNSDWTLQFFDFKKVEQNTAISFSSSFPVHLALGFGWISGVLGVISLLFSLKKK